MLRLTRVIAAAIIPAAGMIAAFAAPAQAATAPSSSIYSATQNACLNLASTNPANSFLDAYGAACNGSAAQEFTFQAVSTGPQDTFHIISQATGQCMVRYRFGIRPDACSLDAGWTFQRVGTTGHRYNILAPSTALCIQVNPQPRGYPGAVFTKAPCNSSASQILSLTTAP